MSNKSEAKKKETLNSLEEEKDIKDNSQGLEEIVDEELFLEMESATGISTSDEISERIREIEIRQQEIAIKLEEYEQMFYEEDRAPSTEIEYVQMVDEYKSLSREKRALIKSTKNSFWDKVKLWMVIYTIIQVFICFPLILPYLSLAFYDLFYSMISSLPGGVFQKIVMYIVLFAFPVLNIFLSWMLYVNVVKDAFDKKIFRYIWIIQSVLTLASIIYTFILLIR